MIITALSEITWLLNIRGRDIPYNPFVKSYVIISQDEVRLYVDNWKLTKNNVEKHLNIEYGVRIYSVLYADQFKSNHKTRNIPFVVGSLITKTCGKI